MKLYNQLCELSQAEKLKSLGVSQGSIYYIDRLGNIYMGRGFDKLRLADWTIHNGTTMGDFFSLYTVAELGVMLPTGYDTMRVTEIDWETEQWHGYDLDDKDCPGIEGYKNEAEARAALLIYLLENNHTTPEEVNTRLNNQ